MRMTEKKEKSSFEEAIEEAINEQKQKDEDQDIDNAFILEPIPDPNLRKELQKLMPNVFIKKHGSKEPLLNIYHINVRSLKNLNISNKGIKSLEGLQHFENLYLLDCSNNPLNEIDVTHYENLRYLIHGSEKRSNLKILDLQKLG